MRAAAAAPPRGPIGRFLHRLAAHAEELDDSQLRQGAVSHGCQPIEDVEPRELATCIGTVRATTLRPRGDVAALVVELYDGTRPLNLVWLGRREIRGVRTGVTLRVTGRVTAHRGATTMFNPAYEILPADSV